MSEEKSLIESITVDTLTAIQTNEYMSDQGKPSYDKWKDYGQNIWIFMNELQKLGFELILILGNPGTGKSTGMRTLKHNSNIWYNADNKNPVWKGGREEYGTKNEPRAPYHIIPKSYAEIIKHIRGGMDKGMFAKNPVAFITAHVETYKEADEYRVRLKTLGNMATNMQLEGKLETVLYTKVEVEDNKPVFYLETQNNGHNTARSPEEMLDPKIPNDYQLVLDKLRAY